MSKVSDTAGAAAGGQRPNHLAGQTSPYLLQHLYNPVDWYPWGPEALDRARRLSRPIFLSVGYSTCHWCHVMERESFEDPSVAALLNDKFVPIKVDREERPDLDRQYMAFVQATTGSGGWPMNVFLTPGLQPFFGGTYFPPKSSRGSVGFSDLLRFISAKWAESPEALERDARLIVQAIEESGGPRLTLKDQAISDLDGARFKALSHYLASFDPRFGGFSGAPKFPTPPVLDFLLREASFGKSEALERVTKTLKCMAMGGIHDHLEGGFHRYSVDARWHVPHFEKMLYDQGQLMRTFSTAYGLDKDPASRVQLKEAIGSICRYVTSHLTRPADGLFFCAEDADSPRLGCPEEKAEGAFAVWTLGEVHDVLKDPLQQAAFCKLYGIMAEGNVDPSSDPSGELKGRNILDKLLGEPLTPEEARVARAAEESMQRARKARPRPHRDDKVLTCWNALMISGLCRAYQVLKQPEYLALAQKATDSLCRVMIRDGRLLRAENGIAAFGDDFAFFVQALLDLYHVTLQPRYLDLAEKLFEEADICWSSQLGAYTISRRDAPESLMVLPDDYDGAEPSANSVQLLNLVRLDLLCDSPKYGRRKEALLEAFAGRLRATPQAMPAFMEAVAWMKAAPVLVVVAGPDLEAASTFLSILEERPLDLNMLVKYVPDPAASALVCRNMTCLAKVSTASELQALLQSQVDAHSD